MFSWLLSQSQLNRYQLKRTYKRDASAGVGKEVTGATTLTYQVANQC